jgi:hypothetical protein
MPPAKDIDQVSAITFMRSIVDIARMGRFLRLGWTWPGMRDRSSWRPPNLTFSTQFGRNPPTNVRAACQTAASERSLARHTGTRIHNARPFRPCGRWGCTGVARLPHCQCSVKTEYNQTNQTLGLRVMLNPTPPLAGAGCALPAHRSQDIPGAGCALPAHRSQDVPGAGCALPAHRSQDIPWMGRHCRPLSQSRSCRDSCMSRTINAVPKSLCNTSRLYYKRLFPGSIRGGNQWQ